MKQSFHGCISFCYFLFYSLEEVGLLDPINEVDVCALHFVYLCRNHFFFRSLTKKRKRWLITAEKKILISMYSFVVFAIFTSVHTGYVTATAEKFIAAIQS